MKVTQIDTHLYRFPAHRKIVDAIQEFTHMETIAAEKCEPHLVETSSWSSS